MVRALDFQPGGPGSNPTKKRDFFFQLFFVPLLRLSCRKTIVTNFAMLAIVVSSGVLEEMERGTLIICLSATLS